jgi:uncharacterized membrane protein
MWTSAAAIGATLPRVLWIAIRWLHLLAMAFFVGGQLFLGVAVVPVARGSDVIRPIARRFGQGSLGALAVLVATGAAMATHYDLWDSGELAAKLALVALTAALVLWHLRRPASHALMGAVLLASLAIVWLGVDLAH